MYKFTNTSKNAMEIANNLAKDLGHSYVGTEHILYGLIKEGKGVASKVLENQAITAESIKNEITHLIGKSEIKIENTLGFTPRTKRVLENSYKEAKKNGFDYIGTEHLLLGIIKEADSVAMRILLTLNANIQRIYSDISKIANEDILELNKSKENINKEKNKTSQTPILNQYGTDLTKQAISRKIRPFNWKEKRIRKNNTNPFKKNKK